MDSNDVTFIRSQNIYAYVDNNEEGNDRQYANVFAWYTLFWPDCLIDISMFIRYLRQGWISKSA